MVRRILDTSHLISYWRQRWNQTPGPKTVEHVIGWARDLINNADSNAIVTPVLLEMVAGARNEHEMELTGAYLAQFRVLDGGDIRRQDWDEARRIAQRIPRNGKPRQLGDCLIKAIANRLNCEVFSSDRSFPR